MKNIYLLRSPQQLIDQDRAGYGWNQINFSEYTGQSNALLMQAFARLEIDLGRQQNQILRFFNISAGDLIVVPVYGAIVLGIAGQQRFYEQNVPYGANQLSVSFFRDKNNKIIRIPRAELKEALQARLKIRMTVVSLNEFSDELQQLVQQIEQGGAVGITEHYAQAQKKAEEHFKTTLLENIRAGETNLKSGGLGVEEIVRELMSIEGYDARVLAKTNSQGIGDIDIEAKKTDRLTEIIWQIQVKHHNGVSDRHGIDQFLAIKPEENTNKCFITTAVLEAQIKADAEAKGITVIEGAELVDWIYEQWSFLSSMTKRQLGAVDVPQLILNT